jgi:hypothetical protein
MKFTIHDLLWLTLIIAIPLGQWVWFRADLKDRIRGADAAWDTEPENARRAAAAAALSAGRTP